MKKLKSYLEKWIDGEKVKGITVTPEDIYNLIDIYNGIIRKQKPEFISGNVKNVLDKCGIKTVECGIGWKIKQIKEMEKMKESTYKKLIKIANECIPELNNRPTLKEMKSDSLDFFETSVWNLEEALIAAYKLGKQERETKE